MEIVNGTISQGAAIEVFIARGKSKDRVPLFNLVCDGELDEEMSELRARAAGLQNQ
jgi:transketolase N-terminal domain/subunit